jgi:hypothetical protein
VRCSNFRAFFRVSAAALVIGATGSRACADPITSSYAVTDLGSARFSTDASGNGILIAPGGQEYPFPRTFTGTSISTPLNFPLLEPTPQCGDPLAFSEATNVMVYPNGIATAYDLVVNGFWYGRGNDWQRYDLYYVRRNSDGSWSQPTQLAQGATNYGTAGVWPNVSAVVSKSGSILIRTMGLPGTSVGNSVGIYNVSTGTFTDLSTLPAVVNAGFSNLRANAIDDDGRILLWSLHQSANQRTPDSDDLLLLTPDGVSRDPIAPAVPEPSTLLLMALAMTAAFVLEHVRARQRTTRTSDPQREPVARAQG